MSTETKTIDSPNAKSSRDIEDGLAAQRKKRARSSNPDAPQHVPVISLKAFREGTEAGKKQVAEEWDRACREVGFLTIVDHGVPKEVIDTMWKQTIDFFDRPLAEKKTVPMTDDYPYGYQGMGMEVRHATRAQPQQPNI